MRPRTDPRWHVRSLICEWCQKIFEVPGAQWHKNEPRRFCSRRCSGLAHQGKPSTPAHRAAMRRGPDHRWWKGASISVRSGRSRANRLYPDAPKACEFCGAEKRLDRHHRNGNTQNNDRSNIAFLCRRCHMAVDGRLSAATEHMRKIQPIGSAIANARWHQ